jgi:endonuclease/exonuclease/phosphatase (EEP) superfamily protein YafD
VIETEERTPAQPERERTRPAWAGWVVPLALALVPWVWFAVRDLSPAMNAVALALPLIAALLALVAFGAAMLSMRMRYALVSVSLVAFSIVVVLSPRLARSGPPPLDAFRLVAANTFDGNRQPRAAAHAMIANDPDVVVAVETNPRVVAGIREALPDAQWTNRGTLHVFARWPMGEQGPVPTVPSPDAMRVEIDRLGSPFVVYAVHLANPLHDISFDEHAAIVERLLRAAQGERLPVVIAGDFNMSDRSTSYRLMDGTLRDAMRTGLAGNTYEQNLWVLLQLRIDHVFVSRDVCAAGAFTFGIPGSDHEGLDVQLGTCAT